MTQPRGYIRYHPVGTEHAEDEMEVDEVLRYVGVSTFDPKESFPFIECLSRPGEITISSNYPRKIDIVLWPHQQDGTYTFRGGRDCGDGRFAAIQESRVEG